MKSFVETLVVVDKSVRDRFDTDEEVKKYVEVLLSLVSQVLVLERRRIVHNYHTIV